MAKQKNQKQAKAKVTTGSKGPRAATNPDDTNQETPVWSLLIFDHDGPWGKNCCQDLVVLWDEIYTKLRQYEIMTWGQIYQDKKRNHDVAVGSLIKDARDRLTLLKLDDYETLFRFRLSGEQRVWGIRDGRVFKLLWWDPEHHICPSTKKNT